MEQMEEMLKPYK
jgi:hypothetical protein